MGQSPGVRPPDLRYRGLRGIPVGVALRGWAGSLRWSRPSAQVAARRVAPGCKSRFRSVGCFYEQVSPLRRPVVRLHRSGSSARRSFLFAFSDIDQEGLWTLVGNAKRFPQSRQRPQPSPHGSPVAHTFCGRPENDPHESPKTLFISACRGTGACARLRGFSQIMPSTMVMEDAFVSAKMTLQVATFHRQCYAAPADCSLRMSFLRDCLRDLAAS